MLRVSLRRLLNAFIRLFLTGTASIKISVQWFFNQLFLKLSQRPRNHVCLYSPEERGPRTVAINGSFDALNRSPSNPQTTVVPTQNMLDGYTTQHPLGSSENRSVGDSGAPLEGASPPPTKSSFVHPTMRPVFPECIRRYDRNVVIPWEYTTFNIAPLTTTFQEYNIPPGWTLYHHPEGSRYFYHKHRKVFTETNIYDDSLLTIIYSNLVEIEGFIQTHNIQRFPRDDLVLELARNDDGEISTSYYFANHKARSIYFLENYDACNLPAWSSARGVTSPYHIKHEIEAQYWYHCQVFPHALDLSHELIAELRDIITYCVLDLTISSVSTAKYNLEDAQIMLNVVDSLSLQRFNLGFLMYDFAQQRFLNFHGQHGARLSRDQSVHGNTTTKRSLLMLLLSPLFFYAPEIHLKVLEKMGTDGLLHKSVWDQFLKKINTQWQEFTLYATVLLNANVAFLAIQSIDRGGSRSIAQVFSYVSTMSSIGSIILGLLLVRQNRTEPDENNYAYFVFPGGRNDFMQKPEIISILFSFPYALLMWGTIYFLAAFLSMCLQNSSTFAQSCVGISLTLIAILVMWCIWMAWRPTHLEADSWSAGSQIFKRFLHWLNPLFQRLPRISEAAV